MSPWRRQCTANNKLIVIKSTRLARSHRASSTLNAKWHKCHCTIIIEPLFARRRSKGKFRCDHNMPDIERVNTAESDDDKNQAITRHENNMSKVSRAEMIGMNGKWMRIDDEMRLMMMMTNCRYVCQRLPNTVTTGNIIYVVSLLLLLLLWFSSLRRCRCSCGRMQNATRTIHTRIASNTRISVLPRQSQSASRATKKNGLCRKWWWCCSGNSSSYPIADVGSYYNSVVQ